MAGKKQSDVTKASAALRRGMHWRTVQKKYGVTLQQIHDHRAGVVGRAPGNGSAQADAPIENVSKEAGRLFNQLVRVIVRDEINAEKGRTRA
jgi:hypothetical protein